MTWVSCIFFNQRNILKRAIWPLETRRVRGPGVSARRVIQARSGGYSFGRVTITTVPGLALRQRELRGASSNLNAGRASRKAKPAITQAQ